MTNMINIPNDSNKNNEPFSVKVIGTDYKVEVSNRVNGTAGEYLPPNEKIVLTDYDNKSFMFKSMWHELLHAVLYLNGDDELMRDEGFVQRTANAITAILEENEGVADTTAFECRLER